MLYLAIDVAIELEDGAVTPVPVNFDVVDGIALLTVCLPEVDNRAPLLPVREPTGVVAVCVRV